MILWNAVANKEKKSFVKNVISIKNCCEIMVQYMLDPVFFFNFE